MLSRIQFNFVPGAGVWEWGTQYNGLYGEWRGFALEGLLLLQASGVRKSSGFHQLKYMKGQGNLSMRSVTRPKRTNRSILWLWLEWRKWFQFTYICSYLKDGAFTAVKGVQRFKLACERGRLIIKKICFSPKVPIQPCRAKSDSAPSGAI